LDLLRRASAHTSLSLSEVASIAPRDAVLVRRNLASLRSIVPLSPAIWTSLDNALRLATADRAPDDEYVAPGQVTVAPGEPLTPTELAWALEQLCRLSRWDDARACAEMMFDAENLHDALIEGRQTARTLDATVRLAECAGRTDILDVPRWTELVRSLLAHEQATSFWLGRLSLRLSAVHRAQRSHAVAKDLAAGTRLVVERLRQRGDSVTFACDELDFQVLRFEYGETGPLDARRAVLDRMLETIVRGRTEDSQHPRRLLWVLRERADLAGDSLPLPNAARSLFLGLPPEPSVTQFIIRALLRRRDAWTGATNALARDYASRLATSRSATEELRLLGESLQDPISNLPRAAPRLQGAWEDTARISIHLVSLTGALYQAAASGLLRRTPEVRRLFEMLDRQRIVAATEGRSSIELRDFWFGWLGYRVWRAEVAAGEAEAPAGGNRHRAAEQDARLAFSIAAARSGALLPEILMLWFRFEVAVRQRGLMSARRAHRDVNVSSEHVDAVLRRFDEQCPGSFLRHAAWARWHRYTWNFEAALESAEMALREAHSSRQRAELLALLLEMVVLVVYSPAELQSSVSPHLERNRALEVLEFVVADLETMFPERREYAHFRRGASLDEAYWRGVADWFSEMLGAPGEYWNRLSHAFQGDEDDGQAPLDLSDLTHTQLMRMVGWTMRWASTRSELSTELRRELAAKAAISCVDALQWERGCGRQGDIRLAFDAASSIALALQHGSGEALFGSSQAPFQSRSGRQLSWGDFSKSMFQSASDQATGHFATHVREIRDRLLPSLKTTFGTVQTPPVQETEDDGS
jgi:hypothetical protein